MPTHTTRQPQNITDVFKELRILTHYLRITLCIARTWKIAVLLIARNFKNCVTHACVRTQDLKAFCFTE